MIFRFWLVLKYMRSISGFFNLTTVLSISGMAVAVASLVVTMGVISGYDYTLKKSVTDVFGHLIVGKRFATEAWESDLTDKSKLGSSLVGLEHISPFVTKVAVMARKGKLSGVVIQGVEPTSVGKVSKLNRHLAKGKFDLSTKNEIPGALVGKGLAKKFALELGDQLALVVPLSDNFSGDKFRPRVKHFRLEGVMDFGRQDFDDRNVVVDISQAQQFSEMGDQVSGYRLRFKDSEMALLANKAVNSFEVNEGGLVTYPYWATSWRDVSANLFSAADYEKWVIFFIVSVLVVAASFNISSTLYVTVMRRYSDISILKAMGASRSLIQWIFSIHGLLVGLMGVVLGMGLGYLVCQGFVLAQEKWNIINAEVYTIDHIAINFEVIDMAAVVIVSLLICFVSTLSPARRGAKLRCTEGLRYD